MQLPNNDQEMINATLQLGDHSINSLAKAVSLHRNTITRILKGHCKATRQTRLRLLSYYIQQQGTRDC